MNDFNEEYEPKEIITIRIERRWKYRSPEKIVKQVYELPVLVIRNTGKAILVTDVKKIRMPIINVVRLFGFQVML